MLHVPNKEGDSPEEAESQQPAKNSPAMDKTSQRILAVGLSIGTVLLGLGAVVLSLGKVDITLRIKRSK